MELRFSGTSSERRGDNSKRSRDFYLKAKVKVTLTGLYVPNISQSMKIATRLDHISYCRTASSTNWSNRWTYRVFIINTGRDYILSRPPMPRSKMKPTRKLQSTTCRDILRQVNCSGQPESEVNRVLWEYPPRTPRISKLTYRGTSLTRKRTLLGPYRRPMPRVLGGILGG